MDYQFYMREVKRFSGATHEALVAHAMKTPLDINQSYFNNRHPGFNSRTFKYVGDQAQFLRECDPAIQAAVAELADVYPPEAFHAYEINSLQVGGRILLHTDQTPTTTSKIWRVPQYHSVHVPCTGQGKYESKRGYGEEFVEMRMTPGRAYAFNNYVLHKVENISAVERFNIVLHFHDPEWQTKAKLYELLNIKEARF